MQVRSEIATPIFTGEILFLKTRDQRLFLLAVLIVVNDFSQIQMRHTATEPVILRALVKRWDLSQVLKINTQFIPFVGNER